MGNTDAIYPPNTFGWGKVAYARSISRHPVTEGIIHQDKRAIPGVETINVRSPSHHKIDPIEC